MLEMDYDGYKALDEVIKKLELTPNERNITWLALMFEDTVYESLRRIRGD